MAKTLKKLVSLLAVLALLMTIAPAALADDTVDTEEATTGDIAALTLEHVVGHQPAGMITEDLTLPTGYTWTAEPQGVIDTATGVITRHYVDDTAVTLTATDREGISEDFALTVKAKTTKIYAADTFAYVYDETADALKQTGFIFTHDGDGEPNSVHVLSDSDGNSYLSDGMTAVTYTTTLAENKPYNSRVLWSAGAAQTELNSEDVIYIEFKMNYTGGEVYKYFRLQACYENSLYNDIAAPYVSGNYNFCIGGEWGTNAGNCAAGTWNKVVLKLDLTSKCVSAKVNDGSWVQRSNTVLNDFSADSKNLTGFRIVPPVMGGDCGTLLIDDFVIYSETADNLTTEEKAEYINSELAYENITHEKASALTANLTLPTVGGLVTWTTSDESVITSAGVITRSKDLDATVKSAVLTASYDGGCKVYNFAVAPAYNTKLADTEPWLVDFEEGTDSQVVSTTTVTSITDQGSYTGFGIKSENTAPTITYKYDADRGLVAKIKNTEGEKTFGYSAGKQYGVQRFAIGFDLNVAQLGEGSLTVTMMGAVAHQNLVFTKDSLTVSVDNTTATYPVTPDENGWIRVDTDNNWAARAQNIYINGTALTGTLKNMIYTSANTNSCGGDALRTAVFTLNGAATVLLDNLTGLGYDASSRSTWIMADAALKAAELYYGDRVLGADTALITTGPSALFGTAKDITNGFDKQEHTSMTPATITYSGTAVNNNVFSADKAGEYEITLTAKAEKANNYTKEESKTITVKGAPVVIETDDTISVSGTTTNGTLIVAQYDADGKMTAAKVYTTFDEIAAPEGSYKVFFITDMTTLIPGAFAVEK